MNVVFRKARREDVPAVVAMLRDDGLGAGRETGTEQEYFDAFDRMEAEGGNSIWVGEADGRLVATFQLTFISGLSHRAARRAQIESVRVLGELRGQGIGALLMAEAERLSRDAGCSMIQLTTHRTRSRAHAFYDGLGYEPSHVGYKKKLD